MDWDGDSRAFNFLLVQMRTPVDVLRAPVHKKVVEVKIPFNSTPHFRQDIIAASF